MHGGSGARPWGASGQPRRLRGEALEALRQADPASAGRSLDQARQAVEQAGADIDRHIEAHDSVYRDLPIRLEAERRLRQEVERTSTVVEALRQGHAPGSWSEVAGHLEQARSLLRSAES